VSSLLQFGDPATVDNAPAERLGTRWQGPIALGLILLLALGLRFWRIDAQSLWYDEGWSIHLAKQSVRVALQGAASEGHTHPPAYYLMLMLWVRLFGDGVLAVRALSAFLGAATVAVTYCLGSRLFGRSTGLVAALLLAVAPAHIVYSQETRMYALLALGLTGLLLLAYECAARGSKWSVGAWALLAGVELVTIYTHYLALVATACMMAWLAVQIAQQLRRGEGRPLARFALTQGAVLLGYLPWLSVGARSAAAHATEGALPPAPWPFLRETWSFLLSGHIALESREPLFAAVSLLCLALVAGATALLALRDPASAKGASPGFSRRALSYLVSQTLLPMLLLFVLMRIRPGYHPRYAFWLLVPLIVLVAQAVVVAARYGAAGRAISALAALLWLGSAGLAARAHLGDPYYSRDDARATAAFLEARLEAGSLVLVDNDDWALRYYLARSGLDDRYLSLDVLASYGEDLSASRALEATLSRAVGDPSVALVKWHQGQNDRRGLLPYLLEGMGTLVQRTNLPGYTVFVYQTDGETPWLQGPGAMTWSRSVRADLQGEGAFRLLEVTADTFVPADEALTVALAWRLMESASQDVKASLALVDDAGRELAFEDEFLRDGLGRKTSSWPIGAEVITYHTLPLPVGLAPLEYVLQVSLYHEEDLLGLDVLDEVGAPAGKSYRLGTVELAPALGRTDKTVDREGLGLYALSEPIEVAPGFALTAHSMAAEAGAPEAALHPGDALTVLLEWHHAGSEELADYWPSLCLVREGLILAERESAPVNDRYPTSWRQPGEVVLDWRELIIPARTASGPAEVQIRVRGEPPVSLGRVQIEAIPRVFEAPAPQVPTALRLGPYELVGYDLETDVLRSGEELAITLYWRKLAPVTRRRALPRTAYVVFTHLLNAEGRLIAQHDGPPADGQRPITGWIAGEYVTDPHVMSWVDTGYQGQAVIEVGLYDPDSGRRVLTPDGDSRLLLPSSIMVK